VACDASTIAGRKSYPLTARWSKFVFEDGSWMLLRLPHGTLLRLYVEAESAAASAKLTREASQWVLKTEEDERHPKKSSHSCANTEALCLPCS